MAAVAGKRVEMAGITVITSTITGRERRRGGNDNVIPVRYHSKSWPWACEDYRHASPRQHGSIVRSQSRLIEYQVSSDKMQTLVGSNTA